MKPGFGLSDPVSTYSLPTARSSLPGFAHGSRLFIQLMPPPSARTSGCVRRYVPAACRQIQRQANSVCESLSLTRASHVESGSNPLPLFTQRLGFSYSVHHFCHTSHLVSWRDANTRNTAQFARTLKLGERFDQSERHEREQARIESESNTPRD